MQTLGVTRRREWQPTPVFLPENPMDGGAWWAAVHGVAKSQTRLSYFTFTFHFHALEKEMATHSSVLAWRIPGTGEASGLPSIGSHSRTYLKWVSSRNNNLQPTLNSWFLTQVTPLTHSLLLIHIVWEPTSGPGEFLWDAECRGCLCQGGMRASLKVGAGALLCLVHWFLVEDASAGRRLRLLSQLCHSQVIQLWDKNKRKTNENRQDFPGGPVVKTLCSQCHRFRFHLWSQN